MLDSKLVLRPLIGLMHGQEPQEIELHLVREIEKHRRLRDDAVTLEAKMEACDDSKATLEIGRAYISAMIAVHAQQTVVSTLLDILGYIPELPERQSH